MQYRNCNDKARPLDSKMLIGSAWSEKKQVEKKRHVNCKIIKVKNSVWNYQEPFSLRRPHFPKLQPAWSLQKCKVSSSQRLGLDKKS